MQSNNLTAQKLFGGLFVLFALIPWVNFSSNNLDSQPWPIILASLYLILRAPKLKMPKKVAAVPLFIIGGLAISLLSSDSPFDFILARAAISYVGLIIVYYAFYDYLQRYGFPRRIIIVVGWMWLFAACIQLAIPGSLEWLAKSRTTLDRGVTSLAPEPTFFAVYLFFSSWLMLRAYRLRADRWIWTLVGANLLAIPLLAQSSMGVLFLLLTILAMGIYYFFRLLTVGLNKKFIFGIGIVTLLASIVVSQSPSDSRLATYIDRASSMSPLMIVEVDASTSQRLEAIVISIHGSIANYLFPAGIDTFQDVRNSLLNSHAIYRKLFWYPARSDKIMSWLGATLFELGVFGLIAVGLFFATAFDRSLLTTLELALLAIILLSAVPLAFPLVPMLLALMAYQKSVQQTRVTQPLSNLNHIRSEIKTNSTLYSR